MLPHSWVHHPVTINEEPEKKNQSREVGPHLTAANLAGREGREETMLFWWHFRRREFINYALHSALYCFIQWPSCSWNSALKLRCIILLRRSWQHFCLYDIQNGWMPSICFKQERETKYIMAIPSFLRVTSQNGKSTVALSTVLFSVFTDLESSAHPSHTACINQQRFYSKCIYLAAWSWF